MTDASLTGALLRDRLPARAAEPLTSCGRPFRDDGALGEDRDALGEAEDDVHVVLDDDHGHAPLAGHALGDRLEEVDRAVGVVPRHAGRRLVQQQQLGAGGEADGELQPALVAAAEMLRVVPQPLAEADAGQRLGRLLHHRMARVEALHHAKLEAAVPLGEAGDGDVLLARHAGKDLRRLEDAGDAALDDGVRIDAQEALAVVGDGAAVGRDEADEGVQERRLAGAVGADDGVDGVLHHVEVDVVERLEAAEALVDAAHLQDRVAARRLAEMDAGIGIVVGLEAHVGMPDRGLMSGHLAGGRGGDGFKAGRGRPSARSGRCRAPCRARCGGACAGARPSASRTCCRSA